MSDGEKVAKKREEAFLLSGVLLGLVASVPGGMLANLLVDGEFIEKPIQFAVVLSCFCIMVAMLLNEIRKRLTSTPSSH